MKRFLVALILLVVGGLSSAQTHVELILDASGSMWNKLADGEYRIVAAKDVLSSFVSSLPADPDLNVGLRVYGSRIAALDEGACQDSDLFVPIAGIARNDLLATVRDTQATGATPIAYSLELAANDLPASGKRVIILVTDGEESCGGDVRGTLETLKGQGIDFDLKIIGFDLDDRAIDSFEGLGSFENATSAEELAGALGRAVETERTATYPVTVLLTRDTVPATDGATVTFSDAVSNQTFSFSGAAGTFSADLPAGAYTATIEDAFTDAPQTFSGLSVTPDSENTFSFELATEQGVILTVMPASPVTGSAVTVVFEDAPVNNERNYITVVPVDAPDSLYLAYAYIDTVSGEAAIRVPDEAQALEARFVLALPEGGSRVIGRSAAFVSVASSATITAPAEVAAGATFTVSWTGPDNERDYLTVVPADATEGSYKSYFYTKDGSDGELTAALEPGEYEVRYVTGQSGATLVSAPLSVTAISASVQAPAEVAAGAKFTASWTGPNNERDYLTVVPVGTPEGQYGTYFYTKDGSDGELTAGLEAGEYEVRYVAGQGGKTIAFAPLTVTAISASIDGPTEAMAGSKITVSWTGPDNERDYLTVVPADAAEGQYSSYFYTEEGSSGVLTVGTEPGSYELRYVAGQGGKTIMSRPITVTAMAITMDAPAEVNAGEDISVSWTGPDGDRFYITVVPAGAAAGEYMRYQYVRDGNPVSFPAPDEAGQYELRYQTDEDVFATRPITIK